MNNGTDVFSCFIDASKAFDCVKHDKLFMVLRNRGMNALDLRFLIKTYEQQNMRTTWAGAFSPTFGVSNGIGQGKMASPTLFCCYLDILLNRLLDSGIGCWIGSHYLGAYADDMVGSSLRVTCVNLNIHLVMSTILPHGKFTESP